jgi:membrane protease YdiL (CAAX protease family)
MTVTSRAPAELPTPTVRSQQWTVRYALAAYVASWIVIGAVSLGWWLPFGLRLPYGSGALGIDAAWLAALIPLYRSRGLAAKDLGLRTAPAARSAGLALLVWVAYRWFSGLWADGVRLGYVASPFSGISHQSTIAIVLTGLAAVVSPVAELVFFVGLLYRAFRNRLGVLPACLLLGVMFAAIHTDYPLAVLPDLAFLGAAFCLLYERTGSLLPGIAVALYLDAGGFEMALTGYSHGVKAVFLALLAVLVLGPLVRGSGGDSTSRPRVSV